jgi:Zn-finger nucleic acid-binding protein
MNSELCPSCGVKTGEMHTFGCPVEVCPWCGGQLNHCNCRFEQLDVEEVKDEALLTEFSRKLEKKGRIAYAKEQRPTFLESI